MIIVQALILLIGFYITDAGYGIPAQSGSHYGGYSENYGYVLQSKFKVSWPSDY